MHQIYWIQSCLQMIHDLFLTHKDIRCLFETTNLQLERTNQWFI